MSVTDEYYDLMLKAKNETIDSLKDRISALDADVLEKTGFIVAQNNELITLRTRITALEALLRRYRDETPIGHQPNMIAHKVDELLGAGYLGEGNE